MKVAKMAKQIPLKQSTPIDPNLLSFDAHNPRFTPDKRPENSDDASVIRMMLKTSDLEELVKSISASGYVPIEPLVIVERDEKLVVLEGNRRLAAIKLLSDRSIQSELGRNDINISHDVRDSMKEILVYRVQNEDDARALIGFKHINGPHSWDAHAKAIFATKWLDSERAKGDTGLNLAQISAQMGDTHHTLRKMVLALYVLNQAEEEKLFSIEDRIKKKFSFSHLYTGLSYQEFTDYIGIEGNLRDGDPCPNPVPQNKKRELNKLLVWLYGSKSEGFEPIIQSQNPNLRQLRQVLSSPKATSMLESTGELDQAVTASIPLDQQFEDNLNEANKYLHFAQSTLEGFDPNSQAVLKEVAEGVLKKTKLIVSHINSELNQLSMGD